MKSKTLRVRGRGPFPLDMLRYDSCWPASQADVVLIEKSALAIERLTIAVRNDDGDFSPDRWRSFGWEVVL